MNWTLSSIYWVYETMDKTIATYAVFLAVYILVSGLFLARFRQRLWSYLAVWTAYPLACMWLAFFLGRGIFDALNLMAMGVFLGGVGLLATCAFFAWPTYKKFATVFGVFAVTLAAVGLDAFIIEPTWLEVRHEKVVSSKISKPIRLVVISDLQTDRVGNFERKVFEKTMAVKPDMVLLPGDYIQAYNAQYRDQVAKLRACLTELKVSAPLGVFATQGDSERKDWVAMFKDLPIVPFPESDTLVTGKNGRPEDEIVVTGLTLKDSWRLRYKIPHTDKFHIVVAHRPDFMLSADEGDLFIAGHTHGGQVQLPFYGPLLTFSEAPREWCGGCCVTREDGKTFMITRGVGMERERAPRLRFFCHPEIVVIDVVPKVNK
jgi:predicted MPP superfamily phosphohydrolase